MMDFDINFDIDLVYGKGYQWILMDGTIPSEEFYETEDAAIAAANEAGFIYREPHSSSPELYVESVRWKNRSKKGVIFDEYDTQLWMCLHKHYSDSQATKCAKLAIGNDYKEY